MDTQTKIKAVIFDLDGTITEPFLDFDLIREQMQLSKDCGPILEIINQSPEHQRRKMEEILHEHEEQAIENSSLNPGVRDTLDKLKEKGIQTAILTRNTSKNATAVTEKHELEFNMVFGRDDGPAKPDAFGVVKVSEELGVAANEVMVVGDYVHDLQAAKSAGAYAVLIKKHKNYTQFLEYADFSVDEISDIIGIIENINDFEGDKLDAV
jgi:HAD superfamily hydrolase (TIGR01549 family)